MPIGTGIIYNVGDLILSQVSGSGTSFLETKIAAATSSIVYFDSTARINSASLSSLTVGTASYVSGSRSIITNLTASNISASGTGSFGMVGIGTTSPSAKLQIGTQTYGTAPDATYFVAGNDDFSGPGPVGAISGYPTAANRNQVTASIFDVVSGWEAVNGSHAILRASAYNVINSTPAFVVLCNGNVGIGTTSPGALLDVNGLFRFQQDIRVNNGTDKLILSATSTTTELHSAGTTGIVFKNSGNNDMVRFDAATGNVGIGTTSPATRLHVYSAGGGFEFGVGSSNCYIETIDRASVSKDLNTGYYTRGTGSFTWNNAAYTERMRIDGSGSVLIGVNGAYNSSRLLQVKDGLLIGNSFYTFASIDTNGTADLILSSNAGPANLGSNSNIIFKLGTSAGGGPDEKMRIVSNGNVGIGTTSPTGSLQVNKASQTLGATIPSGATIISNLAGGNGILELGVDTTNLAYIQSRNITDQTYYKLLLNPSGGSVGIGTTSPAYLLDVSGSSRHGYQTTDTHQFTGSVSVSGSVTAASFTGSLSGSITSALTASYLTPANSYTITNLTASNISASLTGSFGIVGIGTTSPAQKLDVAGSAYAYNYFTLLTAATYGPSDNSAAMQVFGSTGSDGLTNTIKFVTGGSERWRITDAGILQSPAGQTIQTSTGNLTLATGGGDGNILLSPNGIGKVGIGTTVPTAFVDIQGANVLSFGGSNTGSLGTIFLAGTDEYNSGTAGAGIYFRGKFNSAGTTRTTFGAISGIKENNTDGDFSGALTFFARSGSNTGIIHERMRIGSSGNVGIGTTNPVATLQVAGNVSGSSFTSSISNAVGFLGTSSWAQNVVSASFATTAQTANALNTGNSYTITNLTASNISASLTGSFGIVGIGTTSPGYKLDVNGVTRFQGIVRFKNDAWNLTDDAQARFYFDTSGRTYFGSGNGYEWRSQADSAIMTLLNNGNVGIGTTSPLERITFGSSDSIIARSSATDFNSGYCSRILFNQGGTGYGYLGFYTYQGGTGGGERMRIAENGNVGIGTTAPAAKLEISGSSNSVLLNIKSPISGAILYVSGSGAVGIGTSNVGAYTLQVSGSFAATTKSFVIEHPTKAGKKLIYGSLESPYHGIRLTGRDTLVNGKSKIQLPDYIYKLILHDSVNIQLTGIKCNKTLYIDDINVPENYFTIAYDKAIFESYKDYDFFWDFTAIRADVPELQTEM